MDIRPIVSGFSAAPQLALADMQAAADQGYVMVICNRPDGESPGQPDAAQMRAAAEAAGLVFHHLPLSPAIGITPELVAGTRAALAEAQGPVLAYCRSGTRSTNLWALAQAGERPVAEILQAGAQAGYDLSGLAPLLSR